MSKKYLIGIDFGTDSARAVIIDGLTGEKISSGIHYYSRWAQGLYQDTDMSCYRHHPQDYLESLKACLLAALDGAGSSVRKNILSISVGATGSTPCPVNREGVPLALLPDFAENENAMFFLWKDHTAVSEAIEVNETLSNFNGINYTKYQGKYSSEWFWAKILHTSRVDQAVAQAAFSWVELADWIPALLTGNTDPLTMYRCSCAAGHKALWHSEWGGLPARECLAKLSPYLAVVYDSFKSTPAYSTHRVGYISQEWADLLQLPADTIIGGSSLDAHAGAVGAGVRENVFVTNVGTSTVDMMVAKPEILQGKDFSYACGQAEDSILPGYIGIEAGQAAFGDIFAWYSKILSWPIDNILQHDQSIPATEKAVLVQNLKESILVKLADSASKLDLTSSVTALDWFNGRRYPYNNEIVRGTITGLSLGTDAPELYQSLVMGALFGLKRIVDSWEKEGLVIDRLIAVGGISRKSDYIMQMMADILDRQIEVSASEQTCALGAAIYASVAGGLYRSIPEAQDHLCEGFLKIFNPDQSKKLVIEERYRQYIEVGNSVESML